MRSSARGCSRPWHSRPPNEDAMLTALLIYAAASSYWYFWQVLLNAGSARPADVALCALLGLLTGSVLVTAVMIIWLATWGQAALTKR